MANFPTLRRRMIVSLTLMVLGSLAIGGGSIFAVNGLHQDLGVAIRGYWQVRQLFDVGFLASKAREAITANPPQPQQAVAALQSAIEKLDEQAPTADSQWIDEASRDDCRQLLNKSIHEVSQSPHSMASLNLLFARMSKISDQVRESIADAQLAADHKQKIAMYIILSLCGVVVVGTIAIGIRHYGRVIDPVHQIGDGVRAFAGGKFAERINMTGDREFVSLAADFNTMANELETLYRDLEAKVQSKSKELVRAERLASVGYLAAGVAHEINNPLGIIAGYGERAIQQLSTGLNDSTLPKTQKALSVICEEAFRCKQIIDRLLSLARPSAESRQIISIANVADTVVSTLSGLGTMGGRNLILKIQPDTDLSAYADEGEVKQLILNLVLNAMEAVDPANGKVIIEIARHEDEIHLTFNDNGHGMTPDTLDKIFQPFFTEKRGQRPGTGLGLSIAQAIVMDHGGKIEAHSEGLNTGSTFFIRLPAAKKEPTLATA
jgi:signal transduction histidine kinase